MFNSIKGKIRFEAIASDSNKFINAIKESCISADNIQYKKGTIVGNIYLKDYAELKKIGNVCNAQICVLEKNGLIFTAIKYKKRVGLMIGALIAMLVIYFFSDIIMMIEIYGNENISDSYILSLVNDAGIYIGAHKSDVDLRTAERIIVSSSKQISWIGIRSSGSKVQIEVHEVDNKPQMVQKNIPCNIISTKDAQIVDIRNVYSGMLVQMLNNGVKKGDILISGIVDNGKGGVYYSHSIGEIIGRYTETVTFSQPYVDEIIDYKEKVLQKYIHFFGIKIPLQLKENMENFERKDDITYIKILNLQLPIGMIYSEYRPYEVKTIEYDTAQAKVILQNKIKLYESNFLNNKDVNIIDKKVEYLELNDKIKVTVNYVIEGNIGIDKEIMVK